MADEEAKLREPGDVHPYIGAVSRLVQQTIEAEKRKAALEALFCAAQATELLTRPPAPRSRRVWKDRPALLEALASYLPRRPKEKFWPKEMLRLDPVERAVYLMSASVLYSKTAAR